VRTISFPKASRAILAAGLLCACTAGWAQPSPAGDRPTLIAILPVENLTGQGLSGAPVAETWRAALAARGVPLLDDSALRALMDAHRVRFTGGLAADLAAAFRDEAAVTGVLVTSVERWENTETPSLALNSRLVSTEAQPRILWANGGGASGDDHPGFLDLGVVTDPEVLLDRTIGKLADSLTASLSGAAAKTRNPQRRFRPRQEFRHPDGVVPKAPVRIAVLPFTNRSPRRHAGDLVALHFVHQLAVRDDVDVVEPGVVRDILLRTRLIPEGGIPFSKAELLKELLGADLVLTGDVLDYIDSAGVSQDPVVDFMTQLLDSGRHSVVWSSFHHNTGADRVWFFDTGRIRTAGALTSAMTKATVERMLREPHASNGPQAQ
jgi:hypothetical protein